MSNFLVRIFGWRGALVHGDTMVLDRWRWLKRRLPLTAPGTVRVLDVGCGTGAFSIGAAKRGYDAVGLSWDERNQTVALSRARLVGMQDVEFPICDVRRLHERGELRASFDVLLCLETIEHILDDFKLMQDMYACLKPGGRLYLTTPNYYHHPMLKSDIKPFAVVEDGSHVRRGYSPEMLRELCKNIGFRVEGIDFISHYFSQCATAYMRLTTKYLGRTLGWAAAAPLRILPIIFDGWLGKWLSRAFGRPGYSIALSAYKPRLSK